MFFRRQSFFVSVFDCPLWFTLSRKNYVFFQLGSFCSIELATCLFEASYVFRSKNFQVFHWVLTLKMKNWKTCKIIQLFKNWLCKSPSRHLAPTYTRRFLCHRAIPSPTTAFWKLKTIYFFKKPFFSDYYFQQQFMLFVFRSYNMFSTVTI